MTVDFAQVQPVVVLIFHRDRIENILEVLLLFFLFQLHFFLLEIADCCWLHDLDIFYRQGGFSSLYCFIIIAQKIVFAILTVIPALLRHAELDKLQIKLHAVRN